MELIAQADIVIMDKQSFFLSGQVHQLDEKTLSETVGAVHPK